MELLLETIQFVLYTGIIVLISKNVLVKTLRSLAENLKLKPRTVGNIAGVATSVPELLTICVSSYNGLTSASIYNVLSSNIINLIQYYIIIIINNNQKKLQNKAIKYNLLLVIITIILPLLVIFLNVTMKIYWVPIFVIIYILFGKINDNVHNLYLKYEDKELENIQKLDERYEIGNKKKAIKNIITLFGIGILLFFVGNLLGDTLENLCLRFSVPQFVIGILLGFATSIPELMTFFEAQKHHAQKENDILGIIEATNNLLTSNMINLFVIQSLSIIVFSFFNG